MPYTASLKARIGACRLLMSHSDLGSTQNPRSSMFRLLPAQSSEFRREQVLGTARFVGSDEGVRTLSGPVAVLGASTQSAAAWSKAFLRASNDERTPPSAKERSTSITPP